VRIFVGAFTGSTVLVGAFGFFWMNVVWFANPL
jgi:hypothetical protein